MQSTANKFLMLVLVLYIGITPQLKILYVLLYTPQVMNDLNSDMQSTPNKIPYAYIDRLHVTWSLSKIQN